MEFRVLGVIEALEDGLPVSLGGPKQRSVLAMLVLDANRVVSTDHLVDGLWGDDPPLRAARDPAGVRVQLAQGAGTRPQSPRRADGAVDPGPRIRPRRRPRTDRPLPLRAHGERRTVARCSRLRGRRGRVVRRGARVVARGTARRPRRRAIRDLRGAAARGGTHRGDRGPHRCGARPRPRRRRRRARGPRRTQPIPGATPATTDGRALPARVGRRTRWPRTRPRATSSSRSWASSRVGSSATSRRRCSCRTPSSGQSSPHPSTPETSSASSRWPTASLPIRRRSTRSC